MAKHLALVTLAAIVIWAVGVLGGLVLWVIVGHLRWRKRRHKLSGGTSDAGMLPVEPHGLRNQHRHP